jgi:hypothetical protein
MKTALFAFKTALFAFKDYCWNWRFGLSRAEVQCRPQAVPKRLRFRTLEVDLPIQCHQQLHSLQLAASSAQSHALMNKLVREVLNRVAKNLKGVPSPGGNAPTAVALDAGCCGRLRGSRD